MKSSRLLMKILQP